MNVGDILWKPQNTENTQIHAYMRWLPENGYPNFNSYADLHAWSVDRIEDFWESMWKWGEVTHSKVYKEVLSERKMPGAIWFKGARLNFAENLLRFALDSDQSKVALTAVSESRPRVQVTYGDLLRQVESLAAFLKKEGVQKGDRVAGVLSNTPEAIIAMLATTSLGAIWSSCSPDFGIQGILDRFGQVEPKVLFAVDGYKYSGKSFDVTDRIQKVCADVSSIQRVVSVSQIQSDWKGLEVTSWESALTAPSTSLVFEQVPFDHPVYILYSSGTTGVPKCIVHGGGGTILQHIKELRLHTDVSEKDKFFYFTTCGWMMWNWLVSGLMTGAELLLFDGSPTFPDFDRMWSFAQEEGMTVFGTSAKFLGACRNAKVQPGDNFQLKSLRSILSTGSPLLPEDFEWVYSHVKKDVILSSIAGGTDIVSCFVLGNPLLPVRLGEIQCKGLGMDVKAFSEDGSEVIGQQGELVCTKPAPSMPVYFWGDDDGSKYRNAYFDTYEGIWRHGDFVEFTKNGGAMIYGRSDATLNPGGVRIGTGEIYRQVEVLEEVSDSLVVGQRTEGDEEIVLFVVLKEGVTLSDELVKKIKKKIREGTTPRHVPKRVLQIQEVPYTISGKKVELAVAKILRGEEVKNRDALANPKSLDQF